MTVINTDDNVVTATIPVQRDPVSIAVDPTGQRAYVANAGSGSISVLDLEARRQIAVFPAPPRPTFIVMAPDGRTLLVTDRQSGSVALLTPGVPPSGNETALVTPVGYGPPLAMRSSFSGCPGASAAVILPDSSKAFITCSDRSQVLALSLASAPGSWAARQDAASLTDHALALLDVGTNPTALAMKPMAARSSSLIQGPIRFQRSQHQQRGRQHVCHWQPSHSRRRQSG